MTQDLIKELDDYEDIKPFLPFTEILESGYFFSEKGVDNEIRIIKKEDYLRVISRLAVDKKDEDYIRFFHQVFDPEIKYYLVAQTKYYLVEHECGESRVLSNIAKHLPSYTFERFKFNETEYFKNELAFFSKTYPNVYLLILDYRIEVYKENRLTKQVRIIEEPTFGRIYKVKYRQEVF
ncbi:hypothetical protein D6810_00760 [Candidatus Dojkabacteria bacterium]|uniref:Uncharacterized protein n=1 Tax=Candidatus Dojkabacteria bacterium TaxID=2099670 RepID=A0A3M0Z5T5_9BACT|nr:MAG: hypothetical protein D6810_00760 [Candidatus Dojkabacteria bacterium]